MGAAVAAAVSVVALLGGCTAHHTSSSPTAVIPLTPSPSASPSAAGQASPVPGVSGSPLTAAVAGVAPGHGSPAAAYAGFLDAAVAGQIATECTYALPSQQPNCPSVMGGSVTTIPDGPIHIGTVDVVGTQALVVPVGTVCQDGNCLPNSDPNAGIPASSAGFPAAYEQATQTETDPAAGCDLVGGQWYLDLGGPPSSNPVV